MILTRRVAGLFPSRRWMLACCLMFAFGQGRLDAETVYADALASGWQNWSWSTTVNLASASPVQAGTAAIRATPTAAWSGLYLRRTAGALTPASSSTLTYSIHGGTSGGQQLALALIQDDGSEAPNRVNLAAPAANTWRQDTITLSQFGSYANVAGFYWIDRQGAVQPAFSLDTINLNTVTATPTPTPTPGAGLALAIDLNADRAPISPLIYGLNFADNAFADEIDLPFNRWGGNAVTRYNWQNDTSARGSDWYFQQYPNSHPNPAQLPNNSSSDRFVAANEANGTESLITVPLIGYTPKDRQNRWSYSVAKYGAQQAADPWQADAGNGVRTNGTLITNNDPLDTSIAIGPSFVEDWVEHFQNQFGTAANGGVRYYALDNEPMLWDSTHRDVHPTPLGYDELLARTIPIAQAVKSADPGAKTLGPVFFGWTAYFYSALDRADGGSWWNTRSDRMAHGDQPLVEWYLAQLRQHEQTHGTRLLDYLDLHFYPQGGQSLTTAGDANRQALRLRSTRALWDPTYVDESWIAEPVYLIPRMKAWTATFYPGTGTAITEYNWGGLESMNGALAQTDVLGIFGREGLDMANLWDPPTPTQPGAFAFRVFRNYNGAGAKFGDTRIRATSPNQQQVAIFGAQRTTDGKVTLVLINKTAAPVPTTTTLAGLTTAGTASLWRYDATNLSQIRSIGTQAWTSGALALTLPASSITIAELPPPATVTIPKDEWAVY